MPFWVPAGSLSMVSRGRAQRFSAWLPIESRGELGKIPEPGLHPGPATSDLVGQDLGISIFSFPGDSNTHPTLRPRDLTDLGGNNYDPVGMDM